MFAKEVAPPSRMRIDVVELQVVPAVATVACAREALELRPELQRRAQRRRNVTTEVAHRVNVDAVVQHGLQERVLGDHTGHRHGNRARTDDVARLARMCVPASVGTEVSDDHEISAAATCPCPHRRSCG